MVIHPAALDRTSRCRILAHASGKGNRHDHIRMPKRRRARRPSELPAQAGGPFGQQHSQSTRTRCPSAHARALHTSRQHQRIKPHRRPSRRDDRRGAPSPQPSPPAGEREPEGARRDCDHGLSWMVPVRLRYSRCSSLDPCRHESRSDRMHPWWLRETTTARHRCRVALSSASGCCHRSQ